MNWTGSTKGFASALRFSVTIRRRHISGWLVGDSLIVVHLPYNIFVVAFRMQQRKWVDVAVKHWRALQSCKHFRGTSRCAFHDCWRVQCGFFYTCVVVFFSVVIVSFICWLLIVCVCTFLLIWIWYCIFWLVLTKKSHKRTPIPQRVFITDSVMRYRWSNSTSHLSYEVINL